MKIPAKELLFMRKCNVARIATSDLQGAPYVVPVCPYVDKSRIYVASETNARKMRNLEKNPATGIVFDEYHDSWRGLKGVMIQGKAKVVDRKTFNRIRTKIYKKYPKYESQAALEYGESSIIEIAAEHKFSWGFKS